MEKQFRFAFLISRLQILAKSRKQDREASLSSFLADWKSLFFFLSILFVLRLNHGDMWLEMNRDFGTYKSMRL